MTVTYTPLLSGTQQFSYIVSDGQLTSTANVTVTVAPAETIAATTADFRLAKSEWRVSGTGSVVGSVVTVFIGNTLSGPVLGAATVDALGAWALRIRNAAVTPGAARTISIKSSSGASVLGIPLTV